MFTIQRGPADLPRHKKHTISLKNSQEGRGCVLEEADWWNTRVAFIAFLQALPCWCLAHFEKDTEEENPVRVLQNQCEEEEMQLGRESVSVWRRIR